MNQLPRTFSIGGIMLLVVALWSVGLIGCSLNTKRYYFLEEQFSLSDDRLGKMKNQLRVSVNLEKKLVRQGERIYFSVTFTNTSDSPIVIRKPKQYGLLEIPHVNTSLLFLISPVRGEKTFWFPNEYLSSELARVPVKSDEFVDLDSAESIEVQLELPNLVLIKKENMVSQSKLPAGEYILNIKYQNHYIGHETTQKGNIVFLDMNAWVGEVESNPSTLTILP